MRCNQCRPLPEEVARAADLLGRLNELEEAGVLERHVLDSRPPRVEYRLTEAGRRLRYVIEALSAYAASAG